jgi:hypothetical protein
LLGLPKWRLLTGLFVVDANTPSWPTTRKLYVTAAFS